MRLIYLLAGLATALAQSTTDSTTVLQAFNAGRTNIPLTGIRASLVSVNAAETVLALRCANDNHDTTTTTANTNKAAATSSSSNDNNPYTCIVDNSNPVTVTEGPSTFTMSAVYSTITNGVTGRTTLIQDCDITSSTQGADCSVSISYDGIDVSTETSFASNEIHYLPLTVTAGVDKLNAPEATETPDAAAPGVVPPLGGGRTSGIGIGSALAAAAAAALGYF